MEECFRPILSSFASRLERVFSSNADLNSKGSFELICALYESTLRFLSLAYELVAGAFLDLAESGLKHGDSGAGMYQQLMGVMTTIASPFKPYQESFDQLEAKHLDVATSIIAKDMRQVVGCVTPALETLQEATERLKDLAPFIFPLTEGSLIRFELLRGGYKVAPALAAIDQILKSHIDEVVISIRSLSAAMTADVNHLADSFDEQYVVSAMEFLKIAGNFRRDLRTFESKTRVKLAVMIERIVEHIQRENEVCKDTSKSSGQPSSFSIPDSLSVVEIDSVLAKSVCGDLDGATSQEADDTNVSLAILNRLSAAGAEDLDSVLYPKSEDAIQNLARSCHSLVFDVCSAVPWKHLSGMLENEAWKGSSSPAALDSYGTLPQPYITQIGEHMLALVQAFEPFGADQEALAIANEIMDGVRDVAWQPWAEFVASAGIISSDSLISSLMNGRDVAGLVLNDSALSEEDAQLEEGITDEERASAEFCNAWLDAVGLAVTGKLLERVMRIPQFTTKGCEHLNVDLNYFINVFSALGVAGHPHPLVSHVASLVVLAEEELHDHVTSRDRGEVLQGALRSIEARIALLRGVSIAR